MRTCTNMLRRVCHAVTTAAYTCVCACIVSLLPATTTGANLKLILYADGIVPGCALAPDNQRKSVVWYFSFLEFGWRLSYEEVWIPLAFARTETSTK